jgi:hypothetical protein
MKRPTRRPQSGGTQRPRPQSAQCPRPQSGGTQRSRRELGEPGPHERYRLLRGPRHGPLEELQPLERLPEPALLGYATRLDDYYGPDENGPSYGLTFAGMR